MLREHEGCFRDDLIFRGLFGPFSSLLEDLELVLDARGLAFLERLGLGSFFVGDCWFGDRFGDLDFTMCTSAFTVLVVLFVLCLPSSSTWMGW